MNSFQYLNGIADAPVTYTENRTSNVIFDRPAPKDYAFTDITYSFNVIVGTNIVELIGTPNVRYEIDVGTELATIPTVGWPAGVSVLRVGNIYTFYGIDSVSKWNAVKSPLITLSNSFNGTIYYRATVVYDTLQQVNIRVGWEVGVFVPAALLISQSNMTIDADATFGMDDTFVAGFTISKAILTKSGFTDADPTDWLTNTADVSITTAPQLIYENTAGETWTVTVTPSNINIVDTISTTVTGGTASFNNTTKQLTLTGTLTQVNYRLNNMVMTTLNVKEDFILEYSATSSAAELSGRTYLGSQTANCLNLDYLANVRGTAYHTPGISSNIGSVSPLINDPDYIGDGNYVYTLSTSLPSYITNLTSTGIVRWGEQQTESIDRIFESDQETSQREAIAFNGDGSIFAIGIPYTSGATPAPTNANAGKVEIWKFENTNIWTKVQTVYGVGAFDTFGVNVRFATDDTLIIAAPGVDPKPDAQQPDGVQWGFSIGRVYVYKRTTGTDIWTRVQTLTPPGMRYGANYGKTMDLSNDGNLLVLGNDNNQGSLSGADPSINLWSRSGGGSYYVSQTIANPSTRDVYDQTHDITVSGNGERIAWGITYAGIDITDSTYIYKHSAGSNYYLENTILYGQDTYRSTIMVFSQDGNTIWQLSAGYDSAGYTNNGAAFQYNWNGSAWSTTPVEVISNAPQTNGYFARSMEVSRDGTAVYFYSQNSSNPSTGAKTIEEYDFDQLTHTLTYVRTFDVSEYENINQFRTNNDGTEFILSYNAVAGKGWVSYTYGPKPGEYNAGAGTLTITGTKTQVNQDIETITIQTPSQSLYNIPVNFSLLTPESNTDIKSTIVFRQI